MRLRIRRRLAVGAAGLLVGVAAAVAVASPAMASDCATAYGPFTIVVNTSGAWGGTSGNDRVLISANNASYYPVDGMDIICITASGGTTVWAAGKGHTIIGGPGPDTIYGSESSDFIQGNGGNDSLKGNGGSDIIYGGDGADYIRGLSGGTWEHPDKLYGDAGDDCILGGSGVNILLGGSGNDTLLMGNEHRYSSSQCAPADSDNSTAAQNFRNGIHSGGTPYSIGDGNSGNDRVWGTNGVDAIQGNSGDDVLYGWGGNDEMWGWDGHDSLHGGAGDDRLDGEFDDGDKSDQLYGDAGSDRFIADSFDICYAGSGPSTTSCS